jgi:hypothetical protein
LIPADTIAMRSKEKSNAEHPIRTTFIIEKKISEKDS